MSQIQEIIDGLWDNPKNVTRISHSRSGRIMIYTGQGSDEKCFYNNTIYTREEFRKQAIRIVGLCGTKVVVTPQIPEPRRYFNPPNVKVPDHQLNL